jgi:uncharacterized glyoxalase superfamily protein PhnB
MRPTPSGWPRFASAVVYRDAAAAIDWLCDAFGFQIRIKVEGEGGRIEHCELEFGDGLIMIAQESPLTEHPWRRKLRSPLSVESANTQSLMFYVDDADAHCAHARARGARILDEPTSHDYGEDYWTDRSYSALDPEGHLWWVSQRVRTAKHA